MAEEKRGRGRPQMYGEGMTVMKVPVAYKGIIKSLINHLNETKHINKNYKGIVSNSMFLRSLDDNTQSITFTTSPIKNETQLDLVDYINNMDS